MSQEAPRSARDDAARMLVAAFGTVFPVLLGAACVARLAPVSPDLRFALALVLLVPAWLAAVCTALLARSAARALAGCLIASALLALLTYGAPAL